MRPACLVSTLACSCRHARHRLMPAHTSMRINNVRSSLRGALLPRLEAEANSLMLGSESRSSVGDPHQTCSPPTDRRGLLLQASRLRPRSAWWSASW